MSIHLFLALSYTDGLKAVDITNTLSLNIVTQWMRRVIRISGDSSIGIREIEADSILQAIRQAIVPTDSQLPTISA